MAQQSFLIPPGTSSEELAERRKLAYSMLQQGSSGAPIGHWSQGANRLAQALIGGYDLYDQSQSQKAERDEAQKLFGEVLGGGNTMTSSMPPQRATAAQPSAMPSGGVADRIIGVESGGNPTATNPRSSATGAGQFINSTWLDMIKRNRPDIASGKSDQQLLALRNDPNISKQMVDAYAAENAVALDRAGFEPTDGATYLAHFAGPAGAKAVLRADPATPVGRVLGESVVKANPFLANMSAGDLVAWADRKMGGGGQVPAGGTAAGPIGSSPSPEGQPTVTQQANPLGIDPQTAGIIQKLAGNRHTAPLANQLLTAAMKPKSPKDRYVSSGGGLFDTQTQQWMMPPSSKDGFKVVGKGGQVFDESTGQFIAPEGGGAATELTPAQKAVDQAFGKDYAASVAGGGYADSQKNLAQLQSVADDLEKKQLTGPFIGSTPDFITKFTHPEAIDVRERVEEVVQRNLREILGAQFTETEGERLISRAYNPRLPEHVNAKRVKRLLGAMKQAYQAKQDAARHYEQYGTLSNYPGSARITVEDLEAAIEDEGADATANAKEPPVPAVQFLQKNPAPEIIEQFNRKYGPGAAERILSNQPSMTGVSP